VARQGFTLAELLIGLGILGVISMFTIPKLLVGQQSNSYRAGAKEAASSLSQAVDILRKSGGYTATSRLLDLKTYLNYVKVDTTSVIDGAPNEGGATYNCATYQCLKLHNGALLMLYDNGGATGLLGNSVNDLEWFAYDPDGILTTKGDSIWFLLAPSGRVKAWAELTAGDTVSGVVSGAGSPTSTPAWFSWN
jgi:prepilin-type N-terminal cleavage/methylation domain-containing protein